MHSTGFDLTEMLAAIDSVLDDFQLTNTLNIILSSLCGIVVIWHFAQITIQNLLRGGEGFSFENYKKPVFYLIMIAAWPMLQEFIIDASDSIAYTITEQQQQAYNINEQNYQKIDDTMTEIEERFETTEKIGNSENSGPLDYMAFQISIFDDRIILSALQSVYKTALMLDSFLYVMFYFFSKLWLKITLLGGGIAFTVSLLTGGWTVLINWAKTVLSVSLWIPVSALLMSLINSVLLKILNEMTPEFPSGTDVNAVELALAPNMILGSLNGFILIFVVLTLVFFGFKLIILSKVPAIVSGWISGGSSVSGGFSASFIPVSVGKTVAKSAGGAASSAMSGGADGFKK